MVTSPTKSSQVVDDAITQENHASVTQRLVSILPGQICTVCSKSFSVCHQGYRDVERHIKALVHQSGSRVVMETQKIISFLSEK